ncbi:hypothetical protein VAMP_27n198 [Candidatus Vampirococcus lugosii]|uniref:Uncharacterized protein n=1 Tax=Candidatus Vampirococcus lugosii TaxID=2789015 RepID=A0ABS5QKQ5_9BACT|nr:hypothetical protein [Candidatus Vampirococcus lugosii]
MLEIPLILVTLLINGLIYFFYNIILIKNKHLITFNIKLSYKSTIIDLLLINLLSIILLPILNILLNDLQLSGGIGEILITTLLSALITTLLVASIIYIILIKYRCKDTIDKETKMLYYKLSIKIWSYSILSFFALIIFLSLIIN